MLFEEAVKELSQGNYVTRAGWTDGSYLVLLPAMPCPWRVCVVPNPAAGNWQGLFADYTADDWSVVSKTTEEVVVPVALDAVTPDAA